VTEGRTLYELLRHLTPPVVAITTAAGGRTNGMIANSAQRASLVPAVPRISFYALKRNYSHELIRRSGAFAVHLLRSDQWELVRRLGLRSGRDGDKLAGLDARPGRTGCPLLPGVAALFECRVVNAMDAGALTFFLGDVVAVHPGQSGPLLTSEHFRAAAPADLREAYEARLAALQAELEAESRTVQADAVWRGPDAGP
jgi:flavin reductase (DIM6/NTAB) family NADH-FMN oxidoreductase RutF